MRRRLVDMGPFSQCWSAGMAAWLLIVVSSWSLATSLVNGPNEFCERESFKAECEDGEVILIRSATYGRMHKGRCVKTDYGSLGCQSDVVRVMDSKCSGRRQCTFPISDLHSSRSCPVELLSYLEASWECIRVTQCGRHACSPGRHLKLDASSGFLASAVTSETGCGSSQCPWVLQPKPGQIYNVTLFNFHVPNAEEQDRKYCHRYATIKDKNTAVSKDVTICGKEERFKVIHLVDSTELEVRMFSGKDGEENTPFLLRYEAVGCPDIEPPVDGYVVRQKEMLTVKCNFTQGAWHLTCNGNAWVGKVGKCNGDGRFDNPSALETVLENAGSTPGGLLMVVGIGVTLGVILGFVMLAIAVVCMKRRQKQRQYQRQSPLIAQRSSAGKGGDRGSFQTVAESGSLGGKAPTGIEDIYYKTYQPGESSLRKHYDTGSVKSNADGSFPAPPPPPYYHVHSTLADGSTNCHLKEHTYESPNFTAQAQREGTRRGSDVS